MARPSIGVGCIEPQRKFWPQGSAVIAALGGGLLTQTIAFFVSKFYLLKINNHANHHHCYRDIRRFVRSL